MEEGFMSFDHPLAVLQPGDLNRDRGSVLTTSTWRFLAQGDSWFSIGQLPPWATGNLLFSLRLPSSAAAVTLASPGKTFAQMIDWTREVKFATYLAGGTLAYAWDAILLSAGGNDLFDAILTMPDEPDPGKATRRLLQDPERVPSSGAINRYLRPEGWQAFFAMIEDCFVAMIDKRDAPTSHSNGVPIFVHTYDCPQPRNAPAGPGIGPWLSRAYASYHIPPDDWLKLTTYIIQQWAQYLAGINGKLVARGIAKPNIRPIYLIGTLNPDPPSSTGPSGDWENEIHPSPQGYAKLGIAFENQVTLA
ncbi:hypothetical protein WT07_28590 [Burkholderia stagnalis]|nr:hypothetical protein WT07_28590 [Burkholderia stagnalis]KWD97461.1 hypothetical protein WT47_28220 [Burkholderia stagnalis]KWE08448.1 hypothetical protein WT48_27275 [Burkholderia stagnalis]KWO72434.1 hypothetical protein WU00_15735 [Burkholderia stagnalis]